MSVDVKPRQHRLASFIPLESRNSISTISDVLDNDGGIFMGEEKRKPKFKIPRFLRKMNPRRTIDPTCEYVYYQTIFIYITVRAVVKHSPPSSEFHPDLIWESW